MVACAELAVAVVVMVPAFVVLIAGIFKERTTGWSVPTVRMRCVPRSRDSGPM